ncbi:Eae protein [Salmonella enterica]|nr:Eae protein [Salmonella enterica]
MQEVKIYTAPPSDLSPPVQSESFCVDMVLASDYAELEETFMALAAENSALKYQKPTLKAMMACLEAFYADEDVPERAMMAAYNILRKSVGTPDTDAILAEMRAQGVEMAITHIEQTISPNHETVLNEYAAKIRQEAAK